MQTLKDSLARILAGLLLAALLGGCASDIKTTSQVFIPLARNPGTGPTNPPSGYPSPPGTPFNSPKTLTPGAGKQATPSPAAPNQTGGSPTATPNDPPMPTPFWPTLKPGTTSTPYARSAGERGQTLSWEKWKEWPVLPVVSDRARKIYQAGLSAGHDPRRLAKIGDCQVIRAYFLGIFDDPAEHTLGDKYKYLQRTIDQFHGSFDRVSESVRTGFNVASVLTPLYANQQNCKSGESPMQCEFRIWNPSIVIISMETWTQGRPTAAYENYLRQIVEFSLSNNVLPILATKADNLEGDHSINASIARVAAVYDIPLWNFWRATDPLPSNGLLEDRFHLTNGPNRFDWPSTFELGWPMRNLTALEALDKVWQEVKK